MKLSMEIPIPHLEELSAVTDVDFALAHLILENEVYASFYKKQCSEGRTVILDNSFHELGHPLPPWDLIQAARRIGDPILVAPDWLGDPKRTYLGFKETRDKIRGQFRLGVVMAGRTAEERRYYASAIFRDADMLLWPYREPRYTWWRELGAHYLTQLRDKMIHLLGVSTLEELQCWRDDPHIKLIPHVSYDTNKPVKLGAKGYRFAPGVKLRGFGEHDLLKEIPDSAFADIYFNISYMRRFS